MIFKFNIQNSSIPFFSFVRKLMGPSIIIIGFYILGIIHLKGSIGNSLINNVENFIKKFKLFNSSFVMGIIFSLAFCPTLFWLFFGIIVPLSFNSYLGIIYPPIFALGTLMPMMLILFIIFIGKVNLKPNKKIYNRIQKITRYLGGFLLIFFGFIDSLIYWFS
ncbi:sulfite exporter TauE/SafE family protein [Clostridium chromiireducens]|uniref:urease accessory protein UreH domain-containing protein n=1 Tax=Clostridium chromiireducens TaxID=225345 RepID=UPI003AF7CCCF